MKKITSLAALLCAGLMSLPTIALAAETETVLGTWTPSKAASSQDKNSPYADSFAKYGYFYKAGFGATEQNVPESFFPATLKQGDIIRIYYYPCVEKITSSKPAQIQMVLKQDNSSWTWTQICEYADMPNQSTLELSTFDYVIGSSQTTYKDYRDEAEADGGAFVPDVASEVKWLQAHGFWIKGQNFYLNKVEVVQVGAPANPDESWNECETYTFETPFDTGSWGNIGEVPAETFANVIAGDKFRLIGEGESGAQVQLAYKNASWVWTEFVNYADVKDGQYDYVLDDETIIAGLKDKGLFIKGQKFMISKLVILSKTRKGAVDPSKEETVLGTWTPSSAASSQDKNSPYEDSFAKYGYFYKSGFGASEQNVPESFFPETLKEGDIIRIYYYPCVEKITSSKPAQIQMVLKQDNSSWTWTQICEYADMPNQSTLELSTFDYVIGSSQTTYKDYRDEAEADGGAFVPDVASEIKWLQAHGFWMKGQLFYLNKVEVIQVGAPADPDAGWTVAKEYDVEPAFDLNNWNGIFHADKTFFAPATRAQVYSLEVGDKIRILGEQDGAAQVQLAYKAGEKLTWTQFVNYADVKDGKYDYVIDDQNVIDGLMNDGLYVKGKLLKINKLQLLTTRDVTPVGIEDINAEGIDENSPVEYYNMQGMRLSAPEKGQLVIRVQGKKADKVIF